MEMLEGLVAVLQWDLIAFLALGCLAGLMVGALPGFDVTTGVVLLLPITYAVSAEQGLIFFTAMYCAGVFGGSITAILFGIPGTSESVMTALEGREFTRRGEPGRALGIAIVASAVGGLLAAIALGLLTPLLSRIALTFGAPEYFALGVLGLVCVSAVAGDDLLKGLGAASIGVFLSTVGADKATAVIRYHYDVNLLYAGFELAPFFIGVFAAAEILERAATRNLTLVAAQDATPLGRLQLPRLAEYLRLKWTILRSWAIGVAVGILPGTGAASAALIAYGVEVRGSRDSASFGKGNAHGLAATEASNNAAAVASFIPLLSLGIPGSGTTAVLISAFLIHNLQPGPMLLQQNPEVGYVVLSGAALSIAGILLGGRYLSRLFARMAYLPYYVIATGILTVSVAGAVAIGGLEQAYVMLAFGLFGMLLRRFGYPSAPLVIGFVLGPVVELYLRRALLISGDEILPVVTRPVTATLLLLAVGFLFWPLLQRRLLRRR